MKKTTLRDRLAMLVGDEKPHSWATWIGIPASTFSRVWNEGKPLSQKFLSLVSQRTGCSLDWLITGEGPMMRDQAGRGDLNANGAVGVVQVGSSTGNSIIVGGKAKVTYPPAGTGESKIVGSGSSSDKPWNKEVMLAVIEAIEQAIIETGRRTINPQKKAQLIVTAYEITLKSGGSIDKESLVDLITMAA